MQDIAIGQQVIFTDSTETTHDAVISGFYKVVNKPSSSCGELRKLKENPPKTTMFKFCLAPCLIAEADMVRIHNDNFIGFYCPDKLNILQSFVSSESLLTSLIKGHKQNIKHYLNDSSFVCTLSTPNDPFSKVH